MKTTNRTVPTKFGPETRFEAKPVPVAPFRALEDTELERLKHRLLREQLNETKTTELNVRLRRAANEAAALAWATPFPLLVFPALFEEKAWTETQQARRQLAVLARSRELLAA